jgi:hypothetical protein
MYEHPYTKNGVFTSLLFKNPIRIKSIFLFLFAIAMMVLQTKASAQLKLGVNPSTISKSSILELESKIQGLLLTRVPDTLAAPLTSAPSGTIIFFTKDNTLRIRKNNVWQALADSSNVRQLFGKDSLIRLGDVNLTALSDGQQLQYNNTTKKWINYTPALSSSVTKYDVTISSSGLNTTFTIPKDSLSRLADATITSPATGQLLQYNGSKWTNIDASSATSKVWAQGGNAVSAIQKLGTTTSYDLPVITNNQERMRVTSAGNVGIGITDPTNPLVVKDTLEIRRTNTVNKLSTLIFSNTGGNSALGSADFRIGGDGGDIFWQGGGGRNLQMGAYWGIVLLGDRQTATPPTMANGVGGTGVLVQAASNSSVPLAVQSASSSQSSNLTEWRKSDGTVIDVIGPSGKMGINTSTPQANLDVSGNFKLGSSGTVFSNMSKVTAVTFTDNSTNSTAAQNRQVTVAVSGATAGATVIANPSPGTSFPTYVGVAGAWVSTSNNVTVDFVVTGTSNALGTVKVDLTFIQ